jgi:predicted RNA-binding protein YlxR (DUF448 family)
VRPKRELVRVVRGPDGVVFWDATGKRPGRGAYVCDNAACLEQALKTKRLERSLETSLGADVMETLRAAVRAPS